MSLTNPEIDLLLEVLAEDPADEAYREVARALALRGERAEAGRILQRALEHLRVPAAATGPVADDARLLATWAVELGEPEWIEVVVRIIGEPFMRDDPQLSRALALHFDHRGQFGRAAELARALQDEHGEDPTLQAVIDRSMAAAPEVTARGVDPFYTAGRAEAYCDIGRPDLAIRVLRRILAHIPDDAAVQARLMQLRVQPVDPKPWVDDLSEEFWVNQPMEPLSMPAPGITPALVALGNTDPGHEDAETIPSAPDRVRAPMGSPHPHFAPLAVGDDDDAFEEEATDGGAPPTITGELSGGPGPRGRR